MPEPQQQGQEQQGQQISMPQVNSNLLAADDYVYESKPLPKAPFEPESQQRDSGGMSSQFEAVSSALNKNI